ncbi:MAG: sporulation protein YunB [Anaerotruncus sp.]|nr:sporulation protein YunB [Anaerotruncus sp.]
MQPITIRISRKRRRALKLLMVGMLLAGLAFFTDSRLRPLVTTISTYQAQLAATRSINYAVLQVLDQQDIDYDSMITLSRDQEGEVSSISTNMVAINRLKAQVETQVSSQLLVDADHPILIPIGTVFGGQFFAGRGPNMEFQILPAGYVTTEIYNSFRSAGINQTLHQIMLSIRATVSAVAPVYTVTTNVNTNICIAETVIVGRVPEAFTDINGDRSDTIGLYNDYVAEPPRT